MYIVKSWQSVRELYMPVLSVFRRLEEGRA